jgi:hypothetical protein
MYIRTAKSDDLTPEKIDKPGNEEYNDGGKNAPTCDGDKNGEAKEETRGAEVEYQGGDSDHETICTTHTRCSCC